MNDNGKSGPKEKVTVDRNEGISSRDRLAILRNVLYYGGSIYITIIVLIIALQICHLLPESTELTILITVLGTTLTTIIGVIIGSSLDVNKR